MMLITPQQQSQATHLGLDTEPCIGNSYADLINAEAGAVLYYRHRAAAGRLCVARRPAHPLPPHPPLQAP